MADFCKACARGLGFPTEDDLAGLITPELDTSAYGLPVICEGCGYTMVNSEGLCVSTDCMEKGKPGHGGVPLEPLSVDDEEEKMPVIEEEDDDDEDFDEDDDADEGDDNA